MMNDDAPMAEDGERDERRQFGAHLDYLFAAYPRPDGLPQTLRDVGQGTGFSISYLGLLRNQAVRELPDRARWERLAIFFGARATFFEEPLPDDAAEVMARHRARIATVLRHVHVQTRPLGMPLDLSGGEQVLHALDYAVRLMEDERQKEATGGQVRSPLPPRESTRGPDQALPADQAAPAVTPRQVPWWRRLLPW